MKRANKKPMSRNKNSHEMKQWKFVRLGIWWMPPKHYVIVIHDFGMSVGLVTIRSSQAANHHLMWCRRKTKQRRNYQPTDSCHIWMTHKKSQTRRAAGMHECKKHQQQQQLYKKNSCLYANSDSFSSSCIVRVHIIKHEGIYAYRWDSKDMEITAADISVKRGRIITWLYVSSPCALWGKIIDMTL